VHCKLRVHTWHSHVYTQLTMHIHTHIHMQNVCNQLLLHKAVGAIILPTTHTHIHTHKHTSSLQCTHTCTHTHTHTHARAQTHMPTHLSPTLHAKSCGCIRPAHPSKRTGLAPCTCSQCLPTLTQINWLEREVFWCAVISQCLPTMTQIN